MRRLLPAALVLATISGSLLAQVPPADAIPNWSVPETWTPPAVAGGVQTMTDISPAMPFVAISPCRIADTRVGQGFSGQAGPPGLASFSNRTFQVSGAPGTLPPPPSGCPADAIPIGAEAVSVQLTVVFPSSSGNLVAWQGGPTPPVVSVLNWDAGTVALGSGTILPLSLTGTFSVRLNTAAAGQSAQLVIDVNGYFAHEVPSGRVFFLYGNHTAAVGYFSNQSTTAGIGVEAYVRANSNGSAAVVGTADSYMGNTFGGRFRTLSPATNSAGVKGISGNGDPVGEDLTCGPCYTAGVRGVDNGNIPNFGRGVMGISRNAGVHGVLLAASGTGVQTDAYLAYYNGSPWAGYFFGNVHVAGALTANVKPFVQPHPSDPSKEIRYIALEGPQADVYLRGTTQVSRGVTRIPIPDHFRFVADPATYSTLVTPVGRMATVAVLSEDETGIVVEASRDVKIHYVVYAERSAIKTGDPITENVHFRTGGESDLVPHLPDSYRRLMIQNGTLKEDGTVNRETARRLGWSLAGEDRRAEKKAEETARD